MSYTQTYYHIIFATKERVRVLTPERRPALFRYIWGVIKNHECHLYRINGVEDHVHLLTSLHPKVALADLVKNIKIASGLFIKQQQLFPMFRNWQEGYAAFTCSHTEKDAVITYIKNQEEHHRHKTFVEEYREILAKMGLEFNEQYLA